MMTTSGSSNQKSDNPSLTNILVSLQQGVTAINNITKTMKTIFPSS